MQPWIIWSVGNKLNSLGRCYNRWHAIWTVKAIAKFRWLINSSRHTWGRQWDGFIAAHPCAVLWRPSALWSSADGSGRQPLSGVGIFNPYHTRNTLDCDQSNYSSRIVFSHMHIEFGHTGNSGIRSTDPENPSVEPNMKWIWRPLAEIWPFEFCQMWGSPSLVGPWSSVGPQYILLFTLISHTPLRYVRNVAREE